MPWGRSAAWRVSVGRSGESGVGVAGRCRGLEPEIADLVQHGGRLLEAAQHLLRCTALLGNLVALCEQLLEEGFIVECGHELILDVAFHFVDEEVHDGLRDLVLDGDLDDAEVRGQELLDDLRLPLLPLRHVADVLADVRGHVREIAGPEPGGLVPGADRRVLRVAPGPWRGHHLRRHLLEDGPPAVEMRVVRVDVGQLDLDQVADEVPEGVHVLPQQLHHLLIDARAQLRVLDELLLRLLTDLDELVEDVVAALEAGLLQAGHLLPDQHLEGLLRDEERRPGALGVVDGRPDVLIREALARLHAHDVRPERLREDEVDAGPPGQLRFGDAVGLGPVDGGDHGVGVPCQQIQQQPPAGHDGDLVVPQLPQDGACVGDEVVDFGLQLRQDLADVLEQDGVQHLPEVRRAHAAGDAAVLGVAGDELLLGLQGATDVLFLKDVLLPAVDHADVPALQGHHFAHQDVHRVRALVHQVQLREDADGPVARRVDFAGDGQGVGVGQVVVGGGHGEDDAVLLRDVLHDEVADLHVHVRGLVPDRDLRDARQVDEGQVEHVRRVDLELDRLAGDRLPGPGLVVRRVHNLLPDPPELCELHARLVKELAVRLRVLGEVQELQDEGPPGDDAGAAREEVLAHEALQHRALAGALRPHDGDLGQVDLGHHPHVAEGALEFVDNGNELVHLRAVSKRGRTWGCCLATRGTRAELLRRDAGVEGLVAYGSIKGGS
mmetsp:Transcript_65494/g.109896  ORF Transcript_65494/g.109896 Transcript_65494/m.109896 type:complete len:722 (+) Transcript_65494:87-2252(+)